MCLSRLVQVVEAAGDSSVRAVAVNGREYPVSLMAYDGPAPEPGDWLVVQSGYAIGRLDPSDGAEAADMIRRAGGS